MDKIFFIGDLHLDHANIINTREKSPTYVGV